MQRMRLRTLAVRSDMPAMRESATAAKRHRCCASTSAGSTSASPTAGPTTPAAQHAGSREIHADRLLWLPRSLDGRPGDLVARGLCELPGADPRMRRNTSGARHHGSNGSVTSLIRVFRSFSLGLDLYQAQRDKLPRILPFVRREPVVMFAEHVPADREIVLRYPVGPESFFAASSAFASAAGTTDSIAIRILPWR